MFFTVFLCFCVIFGVCLLCRKPKTTTKGLPGPTPLPILGNLLQIGSRPYITFTKWAKYYGSIYRVKLGIKDAIVINDYKLIKELFNETASSGRMDDNVVFLEFTKGPYGIINSSGPAWAAQRKFTLRTLRNFGFAKTSMETMIMDEVQITMDFFRIREGSPILCKRIFNAPVVNALWRLVTGERCQWEYGKSSIINELDEFFKELNNISTNGLFFAPLLRKFAPNLFGWNRYVTSIDKLAKSFQKSIAEHTEKLDSAELRDFIDHHLFEIRKETDPNSSFYEKTGEANMMASLFELFLGGTETTSHTLSWLLLYLSENQKIQQTLQKEIDEVVGSNLPSLSQRPNMPYSEAVITETLRITTIIPFGAPHAMLSDLVFHGYHFVKGTAVFANLHGVHHDPEIWGDPDTFRPERFLNEDGTKCVQNEALLPFGDGKRRCIGETFSKDSLFLFLTCMFQQFNIVPDPDRKEKADFEADFGFALSPKPFKVLFTSRNK